MIVIAVIVAIAALPFAVLIGGSSARNPIGVALVCYAALLPFGSGVTLPIGLPSPFNTVSTLVGLWVIVASCVFLVRGGAWAALHPSVPVWLALLALVVVSDVWSIDHSTTVNNTLVFMSLVLLFVIVSLVGVRAADVRRVEVAAVVGGAAACVYGLWLLNSGRLTSVDGSVPRFATAGGVGDAADPNITAASLLLPALLALSITLRPGRRSARLGALGAFILMVIGIVLTGSRGGLIALFVGGVAIIANARGIRSLLPYGFIVAVVVAAALVIAPASLGSRFTDTGSAGRTDLWRVGARACPTYCLTGSGWATFPDVYLNTLLTNFDLKGHGVRDFKAHNIALAMLIEMGVAGFLLATLGIYLVARSLWRLPRARRGPPLAALVAVLTANMFLSNFNFKYFWFVLTYAAVVAGMSTTTDAEPISAKPGAEEARAASSFA